VFEPHEVRRIVQVLLLLAAAIASDRSLVLWFGEDRDDASAWVRYGVSLLVLVCCAAAIRLGPRGARWTRLWEFLLLFVVIELFATFFLRDMRHEPIGVAKRMACQSNAKQLAMGLLMYRVDFDDRLPSATRWGTAALPYVKDSKLFECPQAKGEWGYAFDQALSEANLGKSLNLENLVLLFEARSTRMDAFGGRESFVTRRGEQGVIAFADAHAKLYTMEQAVRFRWRP
jgi:hypothetical protein